MWPQFKTLIYKVYVLCLMAFTIWYGTFMYPLIFGFSEKASGAAQSLMELGAAGTDDEKLFLKLMVEKEETSRIDLGYKVIEQPYIKGRFHHIGFYIENDNASICVRCHGTVPHDESKEIRSFLNMHAFYVACETCHIRPDEGNPPWIFQWSSKATGLPVANPSTLVDIENSFLKEQDYEKKYITYGNYGSKITPGQITDGKFEFLKRGNLMAYTEEYLEHEEELGEGQKSQVKNVIHRNINEQPIECDQCHKEDNVYIPYAELGYPPRRVDELTTTSVVGMIEKYSEFWIPELLHPGEAEE
jgi:hypothetical protein